MVVGAACRAPLRAPAPTPSSPPPSTPVWAVLQAIADGQILPHYQPVVGLRSGQIVGVEALARWCADDLVLPATAFVPLLESACRVTDLTAFMLDQACSDLARWNRQFHLGAGFHVAVNVSATELVDRRLIGLVGETLACWRVDPSALCLELTETAEISDYDTAAAVLEELANEVGVRLAVDDYGTGFAGSRYLQSFPFDTLKIDQSFVAGLPDRDEDTRFVERAVGYAAGREMRVVAEGIETLPQAHALIAAGCIVGQGFAIAVPGPAADVLSPWLSEVLAGV